MSLEEDKIRIEYEHKLALRRLLIEKVPIAIAIIVLGYLASIAIERYKAFELERQFLLEKRYEAVTDIRSKFSNATAKFFAMTLSPCNNKPIHQQQKDELKEHIQHVIKAVNSWAIMFDENYESGVRISLNIFLGLAAKNYAISCNHREFGSDVADFFTNLNKNALGVTGTDRDTRFNPMGINAAQLDKLGVEKFAEYHFDLWQKMKKKD